ncbi:MAG: hypothetical protein M3N68_00765 [Actinomycetota bacterium]|nr:hypothetical protein [Actinomycetota bacterium]
MKRSIFVVAALLASLAVVSPADGQQSKARSPQRGAQGGFSLTVHAHSSPGTLFPARPIPSPVTEGNYVYSSIPCSRQAPFNDVALNFNPDYPGIPSPAPVRHRLEVTITETNGRNGTAEGTLTTILCENGQESGNTITISFVGRFHQVSENEVRFAGRFEITGGTGIFEDLEGHGSITGSFTCLRGNCASRGVFADAVFRLKGSFRDPTVPQA